MASISYPCGSVKRSLNETFSLALLTELCSVGHPGINKMQEWIFDWDRQFVEQAGLLLVEDTFLVVETANPGGDYCKTESVLKNRSTATQQGKPSFATSWTIRLTFIKLIFLTLCFGLQETGTSSTSIKD